MQAARAAGISPSEIARHARMDRSSVSHYTAGRAGNGVTPVSVLLVSTVDRMLDAVEYLVSQRRDRLNATLHAVKQARPLLTEPRYPTGPLRALIARDCGAVKTAAQVGRISMADLRNLNRETVALDFADRICLEFGVMLDDLYPAEDEQGAA